MGRQDASVRVSLVDERDRAGNRRSRPLLQGKDVVIPRRDRNDDCVSHDGSTVDEVRSYSRLPKRARVVAKVTEDDTARYCQDDRVDRSARGIELLPLVGCEAERLRVECLRSTVALSYCVQIVCLTRRRLIGAKAARGATRRFKAKTRH